MFGSLKTKLLSAFAVAALATAIVGFFGLRGVREINTSLISATKDSGPSLEQCQGIRAALYSALWETGRGIIALNNVRPDKVRNAREARDKAFSELDRAVAAFDAIPITPVEVEPWREEKTQLHAYRPANDQRG